MNIERIGIPIKKTRNHTRCNPFGLAIHRNLTESIDNPSITNSVVLFYIILPEAHFKVADVDSLTNRLYTNIQNFILCKDIRSSTISEVCAASESSNVVFGSNVALASLNLIFRDHFALFEYNNSFKKLHSKYN